MDKATFSQSISPQTGLIAFFYVVKHKIIFHYFKKIRKV